MSPKVVVVETAGTPTAGWGTGSAAPGWYQDPTGRHQARWFNGAAWTDDVGDYGVQGKDAPSGSHGLARSPVADTAVGADRPTAYHAGPRLAGYGARLAGWLIDWALLAMISFPLLRLTHAIHHTRSLLVTSRGVMHQNGVSVSPAGLALHAVIVIAYGALLCGSGRGQTVGMMAVGTRVVDEATGAPIGIARGLGRAAFEYLLAVLLVLPWIIDVLFPIWDANNQTLHDKVSRAVAVTVR